jgi:hypothetical protein
MQHDGLDYPQSPNFKPWFIIALTVALIGLLFLDMGSQIFTRSKTNRDECQGEVNAEVAISEKELAQVLTIPERSPKAKVREVLPAPYCTLPSLQIRAGATAEREMYPLNFDEKTRLIILYEGDEYAGFRFNTQ